MRVLAMAVLVVGAAAANQSPRAHALSSGSVLPEEFSNVIGARELASGRVLISDGRERRLVLADFGTGRVVPIGRLGRGPGEYASAGRLQLLAADSTLLIDREQRWVVVHGGAVVDVRPADHPHAIATRLREAVVDSLGNAYAEIPPLLGNRQPSLADSVRLVRFSPGRSAGDTIALLRAMPRRITRRTGADGSIAVNNTRMPFGVGEQALVMSDGWVAIARLDPYRVDWLTDGGTWVRGTAIPEPLIRLDARTRAAVTDSYPPQPGRPPIVDLDAFPEFVPAFQPGALHALPDGRALVRRTGTVPVPNPPHDIIDRRGRRVGTLLVPAGERVAGAGRSGLYAIRTDTDGLQTLVRYPWPRGW